MRLSTSRVSRRDADPRIGDRTDRGWSQPQLMPRVHVQPPPDGIYDFDFVAEPPGSCQSDTVIHANYVMTNFADTLKGVRVHAPLNSKTTLLDTGKLIVTRTATHLAVERP